MFKKSLKNYKQTLKRFVFAKVYNVVKQDQYFFGFASVIRWKHHDCDRDGDDGSNHITVYFNKKGMKTTFYFGHRIFNLQSRMPRKGDIVFGEIDTDTNKKGWSFKYFFLDSNKKKCQNFLSADNIISKFLHGKTGAFAYETMKKKTLLESSACISAQLCKHNEVFIWAKAKMADADGGPGPGPGPSPSQTQSQTDIFTLDNLNKILK